MTPSRGAGRTPQGAAGPDDCFCESTRWSSAWTSSASPPCVITGDTAPPRDPFEYDPVAARDEMQAMADPYPGRFVGCVGLDPAARHGRRAPAREILADPWVVGLWIHTHSFDRRFDHPDYYPYYALGDEVDVPIVMQAGTSGGLMPSECGQPIGIDRPAIYFPEVNFLLSHTGWPWVDETVAMALKFPTCTSAPGRTRRSIGTRPSMPSSAARAAQGHLRHQLPHRRPPPRSGPARRARPATRDRAEALLGGTARRIFTRIH